MALKNNLLRYFWAKFKNNMFLLEMLRPLSQTVLLKVHSWHYTRKIYLQFSDFAARISALLLLLTYIGRNKTQVIKKDGCKRLQRWIQFSWYQRKGFRTDKHYIRKYLTYLCYMLQKSTYLNIKSDILSCS